MLLAGTFSIFKGNRRGSKFELGLVWWNILKYVLLVKFAKHNEPCSTVQCRTTQGAKGQVTIGCQAELHAGISQG